MLLMFATVPDLYDYLYNPLLVIQTRVSLNMSDELNEW